MLRLLMFLVIFAGKDARVSEIMLHAYLNATLSRMLSPYKIFS